MDRRTIEAYEAGAPAYLDAHRGVGADLDVLLRGLAARIPRGRVLEIGSGPGTDADRLEQLGLSVDRTDAAAAFVDRLRARGHPARLLDVRTDDLGGPWDGVLADAVLLHLRRDELPAALVRLRGATRLGGVLALTMKAGEGESWTTEKVGRPRFFTYWRPGPLRAVLTAAGWEVVQLRDLRRPPQHWLHVLAVAR